MTFHKILETAPLFFAILYLLTCTQNSTISGTIDETGTGKPTAAVIGLVVYENDVPVVGASVNLYNSRSVKKMVTSLKKKTASSTIRNTQTNINGLFRIDSVDTGRYYLEINDHDTLGALVETGVKPGDTIVEVNATLRRMGAIQGIIDTGLICKTGKTYVYVNELQRYIEVDTSGLFQIENVPPYNYTLKIIHDTVIIGSVLDSVSIPVSEGDTACIGNRSPVALLYIDTATGVAAHIFQILYKTKDPDSDSLVIMIDFGDKCADTLNTTTGYIRHTYSNTGEYMLRLTVNDKKGGIASDSKLITVLPEIPTATALLNPIKGATGVPVQVTLFWSAVGNATAYTVHVASDSLFVNSMVIDSTVCFDSITVSDLQLYQKYFWRIRAKNECGASGWSEVSNFTTILSIPGKPVLSFPSDLFSGITDTITFSWESVPLADVYHFQLSVEATFRHLEAEYLSLTAIQKTIANLQKGMDYYWRVQAANAAGTGEWSSARKFSTVAEVPVVPELALPLDSAHGIRDTVTLSWHAASGATVYRLEVAADSAFQHIMVTDSTLTMVVKNVAELLKDTTLYWRVKAANARGVSGWSQTRVFYTNRVGAKVDIKEMSNWTIIMGSAANMEGKLIVGDEIAQGDKIESIRTFVQPFTFVWWGSYPSTTLSYHTMNVFDSLGTTAFSFFTRYQNPGCLGYTINIDGSYENVISGITAVDNKITGEFRTVFEDDTVKYFVNGDLIAKRAFAINRKMRISFTCHEHPFLIDSIYVVQY